MSIPHEVVSRVIHWTNQKEPVRAMLLTGTRANPHASVDIFSDYDVVLIATDIHPFFADRPWLQDFGEVLVVYWDPIYPDPDHGIEQTGNVTQYADGLKIDLSRRCYALVRDHEAIDEASRELAKRGYRLTARREPWGPGSHVLSQPGRHPGGCHRHTVDA